MLRNTRDTIDTNKSIIVHFPRERAVSRLNKLISLSREIPDGNLRALKCSWSGKLKRQSTYELDPFCCC